MGYHQDAKDQLKIEEYYLCRKNLIELNYAEPPFNNEEYLEYQNKSYNIAFVIDKRIKDSIKQNQEKLEQYPECKNFKTFSDDFKKCVKSLDSFKTCVTESKIKTLEKEGLEKLICQKQAYVRFNDNMIKNSDRVDLEIETRNYNSDRDNKNNFESIGINEKDFLGKELKKKVIIEDEKIKNTVNNNNDNIYSKYEISKLRKKFISSCLKIIDKKIKNYEENLMQQCQKIKYLD
jgi:hypothetical protein